MRYEGQIYRPPREWRSKLRQCTVRSYHNNCHLCGMYKHNNYVNYHKNLKQSAQ